MAGSIALSDNTTGPLYLLYSMLETAKEQYVQIVRVLFAAVFGFCISWIPHIVTGVLEFGFEISIPTVAQSIPDLFAFISAWINPIIYGIMNRAMRKEFVNILLCRKEG